mmetsp:Transcript_15202/g.61100  ORF Transcript_15202/g.61100 Transcript_15202/m.61100 type:complete len:88 (+) Transcript_15202:169-432(+)
MDLNLVARPFQLFDVVWLLAIMLGLVSLLARPVRADEDDDDDDDDAGRRRQPSGWLIPVDLKTDIAKIHLKAGFDDALLHAGQDSAA